MEWPSVFRKKNDFCSAVIVAAGSASRMKGTDKILADIGGKPLIAWTLHVFQRCSSVQEIVVVTREDLVDRIKEICRESGMTKVHAVVPGGASRPESVMLGLNRVSKLTRIVAIHDGARPFVTEEIVEATIDKARKFHAVAPAVPVKDTIKQAQNHIVTDTPERSRLFAVQTPQVFDFDLLRGALKRAMDQNLTVTDDCSAVEAMGMSVYLTQGSDENIKITTPTDLVLAQAILENRRSSQ